MKGRLLAILGSPHNNGATWKMLDYAMRIAKRHGYVVDYIHLYEKNIAFCKGCRACIELQDCVIKDDIQEISRLLRECNIIIVAAPVYWANVPAIVKNMFDRLLGVMMEKTGAFPKPRLSNEQKYILFTACNTPASTIFQSRCFKNFPHAPYCSCALPKKYRKRSWCITCSKKNIFLFI